MAEESSITKIEKLNGSNFQSWKHDMKEAKQIQEKMLLLKLNQLIKLDLRKRIRVLPLVLRNQSRFM